MSADQCKLLVVEDDAEIRQAMCRLLELEGYSVKHVSNGEEALQALSGNMDFGLILLDMFMPTMDGWEFLKRYEKMNLNSKVQIPVLVTTATHEGLSEVQGKVQGILKKPFSIDLLLVSVRKLLAIDYVES